MEDLRPLTLHGKELKMLGEVKYLGVILDSKLNWNQHLQEIIRKARTTFAVVIRMYDKKGGIRPNVVHNLSAYNTQTGRGQIICTRTVYVVCRLGWKTTDKVCRSGRVRVQPEHTCFLRCVSLLAESEPLTCGWTKEFLFYWEFTVHCMFIGYALCRL
jgi:hypothetical protein